MNIYLIILMFIHNNNNNNKITIMYYSVGMFNFISSLKIKK